MTLLPAPPAIEKAAQQYAARLISAQRPTRQENEQKTIEYHEVNIDSLELTRPRSIGVGKSFVCASQVLDWENLSSSADIIVFQILGPMEGWE